MRLHGYCTSCRRVRLVSVSAHALALAQARGGVVEGICHECEEKERPALRREGGKTVSTPANRRHPGDITTHPLEDCPVCVELGDWATCDDSTEWIAAHEALRDLERLAEPGGGS